MKMDEQAPLLHQKFMLKMSNSSDMKESDAAKIDAVLKGMKCSGNATISSETKNERGFCQINKILYLHYCVILY